MRKTVEELNKNNAAQAESEIYLFQSPLPIISAEYLKEKIAVANLGDNELQDKLNLDNLANQAPLYAVAVSNANLRLFPTTEANYKQNYDIDYWAVRQVKIGERLVVWHDDKSKSWCFVQSNNAWGWISKNSIAYLDSSAWLKIAKADFVQIVAPKIEIYRGNGQSIKLYYGTKLCLADIYADQYQVILPQRNINGEVTFSKLSLPKDKRTNLGYLALSQENIIAQGAQFLGEKYYWGGKNGGHDCTSLISDLFGSCGVIMPSNSYKQLCLPDIDRLSADLSTKERKDKIIAANIGSVLLFKGHGMLYTGERNGKLTILHSVYRLKRGLINKTTMGTLEEIRENGQSLLDSIEGILDIW